jgi:hypothetical protein
MERQEPKALLVLTVLHKQSPSGSGWQQAWREAQQPGERMLRLAQVSKLFDQAR